MEEGVERPIPPREHVLQHLGVHVTILGPHIFERWLLGALPGGGDTHTAFLPGIWALLESGVVEFTAATQDNRRCPLLLRRRLEFVLECLAYALLVRTALFRLIATQTARGKDRVCPFHAA